MMIAVKARCRVAGAAPILVLLATTAMSSAANLHIDHVTVCGSSLAEMTAALESAAGVKAQYGGPHANHATEMSLVSFPDGSYLELIAVQPKADAEAVRRHEWSPFLNAKAGPCAWAIQAKDIDAEAARMKRNGVAVHSPEQSGRARPDGFRLEWQTAQLGDATRGSFFPFLIRDITPREKRAFPAGQPTDTPYAGIARVVIGVPNLEAAVNQYRKAFELAKPRDAFDPTFGAKLAWFSGTPVILAEALDQNGWLAKRVAQFGSAPCGFLLSGKPAEASTKWFGDSISWFDRNKLGWRLGVVAR